MEKVIKILVPIDYSQNSESAYRYALILADQIDAQIEVLHVVYPQAEPLDFPAIVTSVNKQRMDAVRPGLRAFVEKGVTAVVDQLKSPPAVTFDIELGTPANVISRIVKRDTIDLVVMGTRGENRSTTEKILGSVTAAVVEKANCAVMVIPENVLQKSVKKVAYATDVLDADPFELWKAMDIMDNTKAEYHLVHVNLKKEGDGEAGNKLEEMQRFFEQQNSNYKIYTHHLPGEKVTDRLNEFIEENEMDLLVMYKPAKGWWEKQFHKSVTRNMALKTQVPTLIMKN